MKKRFAASVLFYLLGAALFLISQSATVSSSPIQLSYFHRLLLCGASVCFIGAAPFIPPARTRAGVAVRLAISAAMIGCIIAWGGFSNNAMA